MASREEIRAEFERLRQQDIERYEAEVVTNEEASRRLREQQRHRAEQFEALAREYGVDLGRLQAMHDREAEYIERYLAEIRPPLVNRESLEPVEREGQAFYAEAARATPGKAWAELDGVYVLAPRVEDFEDIPGRIHNPWLLPDGTDKLYVGQKWTGSGSGCWGGYIYAPTTVTASFHYTPPTTGNLLITAQSVLHGFYIVRADDGCWDCKSARAWAGTWITTIQNNYYQYSKADVLVDYDDDNIDKYGIFDEWRPLECYRLVQSNNPLYIKVSFSAGVLARGGGSYAEVNFKTGANYIYLPCVTVQYV
jgi:hypothetical protein